jgi:uncharacterized protein YkwD
MGRTDKAVRERGTVRLRAILALGAVLLLAPVAGLSSAQAGQAVVSNGSASADAAAATTVEYEAQLIKVMNAVRRQHGLRPLRVAPQLIKSARVHSAQMAQSGYFSHNSPDGSSFSERIARYFAQRGYRYWAAGETLLWSAPVIAPEDVVQRWLASPPHRRTLLSSQWVAVGTGVIQTSSGRGLYSGHTALLVTVDYGVRR